MGFHFMAAELAPCKKCPNEYSGRQSSLHWSTLDRVLLGHHLADAWERWPPALAISGSPSPSRPSEWGKPGVDCSLALPVGPVVISCQSGRVGELRRYWPSDEGSRA